MTDADATKPVSFRLTEPQHTALSARAAEKGMSPGRLARALVLKALGEPDKATAAPKSHDPAGSPASDDRLRRAVWVLLVALSPELDEDRAESLLREHFDPSDVRGGGP